METETRTSRLTANQLSYVRNLRMLAWTAIAAFLVLAVLMPDTGWMILNSSN